MAGGPLRRLVAGLSPVAIDAAYIGLLVLGSPLILPVLLASPRWRSGLRGRLGSIPRRDRSRPGLWIHAVSVGEVLAAQPLIRAVREALPDGDVWVSSTTLAGRRLARERFGDLVVFPFPFDSSFLVRRALRNAAPDLIVLMELEIWPNLLLAAGAAGVPVLIANGRITERSFRRWRVLGPVVGPLIRGIAAVAAQNEDYARRFRGLGIPEDRIRVTGNLKYDVAAGAPRCDPGEIRRRLGWPEDVPVWVCGCTHPGEEDMVLEVWRSLEDPRPRMVIAPRHVERSGGIEDDVRRLGLKVARWSTVVEGSPGNDKDVNTDVLLLDTIGDLVDFYGIANVAFVGGSLAAIGGHNMIEPASLGKPVIFGPHVGNFLEVAALLEGSGGGIRVEDARGLGDALRRLLADDGLRRDVGERAQGAVESHRGAVRRHVEMIQDVLARSRAGGPADA